ncbi:MAG: ATP-binding protein [Caldilineaceae bacterium]
MQHKQWPFTPMCLSEVIGKDTLSVLEAGCAERLGRAMTLIDYDAVHQRLVRTDPINARQNFEPFCHLLRDESRVQGGKHACETCDLTMAQAFLESKSLAAYREFQCHMGLQDAAQLVELGGRPVAVLFAGQFRPPHGLAQIQANVRQLGTGRYASIRPIDEAVRSQLLTLSERLTPLPPEFQQQLAQEAHYIQRIAEAEYQHHKHQLEHKFLDGLRNWEGLDAVVSLSQLRQHCEQLLQRVQRFCGVQYLVLFANMREGETVLAPVAQAGLPEPLHADLPHFNWKKAGLPLENLPLKPVAGAQSRAMAVKGIRGDHSEHFSNAAAIHFSTLGAIYRSTLVFGPFAENMDAAQEQIFLGEISRIIGGLVLPALEILNLRQQQQQWESTAKLLTHQVRTALTPITTQIGMAKLMLERPAAEPTNKLINNALKGAHELCLRLGKSVSETMDAHVLLLEPEDMKFEPFPLSVLASNCADCFALEAERRQRYLRLDDNIEQLPQAEVDIARLTIALSNLINNAVKYSYPNTKILLRATPQEPGDLDFEHATIEIQNDGDEIAPELRDQIFERGVRGLTGAKLRRIPGTGLGLWEARAVVEAHGGKLSVRCEPTTTFFRQMRAYRVTFQMKIPLRQGRG